jgi:NitT/TauT family transport system ATP-binding protein
MIAVANGTKRFDNGTLALDGISVGIAPGEFVALLGPSGCGKSTLLRILAGLDTFTTGTLSWEAGRPPAPGGIGFVFQDATLLPWATAAQNVALPLRLRGLAKAEITPHVAAALADVGLADFADARPRGLSGGMKMRVSIARALVSRPALLLMDEPFAALDEFTRHRLQADLRRVWRESGTTIVFVTHSIYEAAYLARRVLVMSPHPGRIMADLPADLPETPDRRDCAAYTALVHRITETFREVMPA